MPSIFISYSHFDTQFVNTLEDRLANENIPVWVDRHLRGGDEWKKQIDLQIKDSAGVIVVMTPAALASPYVTYEWAFAKGLNKPVVPILLQHVTDERLQVTKESSEELVYDRKLETHPRLDDHQRIDFTASSELGWEKLIADLKIILQGNIPSELMVYWDELSSSNSELRKNAIETLEKYQDDSANEVLAQAIIQKKLRDVKEGCAIALAHRTNGKDARVIQGFQELILAPQHVSHAVEAVNIVSGIDTPEAVTYLLLILTKNEDWKMRMLAANGLGQLKAIAAADTLLECIEGDKFMDVKTASAQALANMDDSRVIEKILPIVKRWIADFNQLHEAPFRSFVTTLTRCGDNGIEAAFNLIRRENVAPVNPLLFIVLKTVDRKIISRLIGNKLRITPAGDQIEVAFWRRTVTSELST